MSGLPGRPQAAEEREAERYREYVERPREREGEPESRDQRGRDSRSDGARTEPDECELTEHSPKDRCRRPAEREERAELGAARADGRERSVQEEDRRDD